MEKLSKDDALYNLWLLFIKSKRCMFKAREKELAPFGITPEQASILHTLIHSKGKTTRTEISRVTCREVHTVSGLIARMEEKGYIRLEKDADNRRITWVFITDKGKEAYEKSRNRETIKVIFDALTDEQKAEFEKTLKTILDKAQEQLMYHYKPPFLR